MKRIEEFEMRMDELMKEFSDVPYEDLADSLEYYAADCINKSNR